MSKALHYPIDSKIATLVDIPYTISYVIRKRSQLDNLLELPKDKRPPDKLIWDNPIEELEKWIESVMKPNAPSDHIDFLDSEIEE